MQHFSPVWCSPSGTATSTRCTERCYHTPGKVWLPVIYKAFRSFLVIQLRRWGCSKPHNKWPPPANKCSFHPPLLAVHLLFKMCHSFSQLQSAPTIHFCFSWLPSVLVFPACYSSYRPCNLMSRQVCGRGSQKWSHNLSQVHLGWVFPASITNSLSPQFPAPTFNGSTVFVFFWSSSQKVLDTLSFSASYAHFSTHAEILSSLSFIVNYVKITY